jgi:neogenin
VISGISFLLLIVVGTLLCRSRNTASGGYMSAMRKPKGYIAAATSPAGKLGSSTGKGKGSSRELKPPDLWIHHNEHLEMKAIDKSLTNDTMTVTPIQRNSQEINTDIIEKSKKTTSTYGDSLYDDINKDVHKRASSPIETNATLVSGTSTARKTARAKPIMIPVEQTLLSNGTISMEPSTGLSRPLYPRTQFNIPRAHVTLDSLENNTVLSGSHHLHHLYDPVASPSLHMGLSASPLANGQQMPSNSLYSSNGPSSQVIPNTTTSPAINYSIGKRQSGHPLRSFSVPAPPPPPLNSPPTSGTPHNGLNFNNSILIINLILVLFMI